MRRKKIEGILCLTGMLLLTGCGTKAYDLTEAEESQIVNYATHVVSKYNAYQKDGLVYVDQSVEETEPEETVTGSESVDGTEIMDETPAENTLEDVFGADGLEVTYGGVSLAGNYTESDVLDVRASNGKQFMTLAINMTNPTEEDITLDNLTSKVKFTADYSADGAESTQVSVYTTIMTTDFSTYDDEIPAGETKSAVLLFEIPDSVTEVSDIVLHVTRDDTTYEIKL